MTLCLTLWAGCLGAEPLTIDQHWSVRLLGLPVGQFLMQSEQTTSTYRGTATFHTTGAAGAVADVRFHLRGSGRRNNSRLIPSLYQEEMNTGRRQSAAQLSFEDGRVTEVSGRLNPTEIAPAVQNLRKALDPFSAILTVLAPQTRAPDCALEELIFDGTRVTRLKWRRKSKKNGAVVCIGTYDRVAGYSSAQLAEASAFPIRVTYRFDGSNWRASRANVRSLYGPVTLLRKD